MVGPKAKKSAALHLVKQHKTSERRVVKILGLSRSTLRYKSRSTRDDSIIITRMKELASKHRRFGLPRIYHFLKKEGFKLSWNKAYRIYKEQGLQLKKRRRQKLLPVVRVPLGQATRPNDIWSFDFVFDRTEQGRALKFLTIVDDFSKKSPGILVGYSIGSRDMILHFNSLLNFPTKLRCDNGPEMTSKEFFDWCENKISVEWIEPGKPTQNAYIESFNGKFRDEFLNEMQFFDIVDAQEKVDKWLEYYNQERPHSSLGYKTPIEFESEFKQPV